MSIFDTFLGCVSKFFWNFIGTFIGTLLEIHFSDTRYSIKNTSQPQYLVVERILAGAIRIELISLVLETKAQPLYQTPKQRAYYITKKRICQLFFDILL